MVGVLEMVVIADEDGRIWILLHSGSRGGGNRLATITKCTRCNKGCYARIFQGLRIKCVCNPESGLERYNPQYTQWAARHKAIERRTEAAR